MVTKSRKNLDVDQVTTVTGSLKDFASIEQGVHFREIVKEYPSGEIKLIQIKNVIPDQPIHYETLARIHLKKIKDSQYVKPGDVLFISRAERKIAVALSQPPKNVTVGAQFFIIRVFDDRLYPGYLAWYINQRPAQEYIEKHSRGSNVQVINKQDILNLPVIVPSQKIQEIILHVHKLKLREAYLMKEIRETRQFIIEAFLLGVIYAGIQE